MINCTWGGGDTSHGSPAQGILVLNDSTWESTGQDLWFVKTMTIYQDKLFIGGTVENTGNGDGVIVYNDTVFFIPNYNGTIPPRGTVYCFSEMDNHLHAGGNFLFKDTAGIILSKRVCYLNSSISYSSSQICEGEVYDFNGQLINSTGIYFDTLLSQSGSDSIVALYLTVAVLNPSIILSNDTLTATGNGAVQWYDCNTQQIINGATNNTYIATSSGDYAAIITNGNCSDTTACKSYNGMNELQNANNELQVYPNPSTEKLNIKINSAFTHCNIEISNLLGEKIILQDIESTNTSVNIQKLPSGIYFIKVKSDEWSAVRKVVKE